MKKYIFFCDASQKIGLGHISRLSGIASHLKETALFGINSDRIAINYIKNDFDYLCKEYKENNIGFIKRLISLYRPKAIIIDNKYSYTKFELSQIKKYNLKIIFIDSLCDGLSFSDEIICPGLFIDLNIFDHVLDKEHKRMIRTGADYVLINHHLPQKKELSIRKYKKK